MSIRQALVLVLLLAVVSAWRATLSFSSELVHAMPSTVVVRLTTKLTASDADVSDIFGHSVAVGGDTIVVGARNDQDGGVGSGSAYVFREHESAA